MNRQGLAGLFVLLGVLLVLAGVIVMAVIVPGMKRLPDDVDTIRMYDGSVPVLLNAETFQFLNDLDVTIERHVKVEETDGDVALVLEALVMTDNATGAVLQSVDKHHALDRKTMEFAEEYPESWTETAGFAPRGGLIVGWPIDTEKKDYLGWSDDYADTVDLTFVDSRKHEGTGLETYFFTSSSERRQIAPAAVAAMGLPATMTEEQLTGLVAGLDINPTVKMALPLLVKQVEWPDEAGTAWPEPVNLVYYYEYTGEYWVEPDTGVLIDTHKIEHRSVGLEPELIEGLRERITNLPIEVDPNLLDELLPLPVYQLEYQATPDSAEDAKKDAQDAIDQLNLFGQTLPIGAIVLGAVFVVLGGVLFTRRS